MSLTKSVIISLFSIAITTTVKAEIVLDGSMGVSGSLSGPNYIIQSDYGQLLGGNLFHSFDTFNINLGESAAFTGPDSVENIIGRVTGSGYSWIDGYISSTISGADLYLLNPAGVIFGPNATVDLSGSFHVSTADYLSFADDNILYADPEKTSWITSSPLEAFGFLAGRPGPIVINGSSLWTSENSTLSVVGGNIEINNSAFLAAPGGRINLASVASSGEILLQESGIESSGFEVMGNINLYEKSYLYTSGDSAGQIFIKAGQFYMDDSYILADTEGNGAPGLIDMEVQRDIVITNNSYVFTDTLGHGVGGDINITSNRFSILDNSAVSISTESTGDAGSFTVNANEVIIDGGGSRAGLFSEINKAGATGNGSDVTINCNGNLTIQDGGVISLYTYGAGDAGNLIIDTGDFTIDGMDSQHNTGILARVNSGATGYGGDVTINSSGTLAILNNGEISTTTHGPKNAGTLTINADDIIIDGMDDSTGVFAESTESALGNGGNVTINSTGVIDLQDGGIVSVTTYGEGDAGSLTINTVDLTIDRENSDSSTGLTAQVNPGAAGNGGDITITSDGVLTVQNIGIINTTTYGGGNAGNLIINSNDLVIDGGGLFAGISAAAYYDATGSGGDVTINSSGTFTIINGGLIAASTYGEGDAGNIIINANDLKINGTGHLAFINANAAAGSTGNGGSIVITGNKLSLNNIAEITTTSSSSGTAGDIAITANDSITLNNSEISTEALYSDGGNITINSKNILQLSDSKVSTTVGDGEGNGGNITIDPTFVILDNSDIIANAYEGSGGNISLTADYLFAWPNSAIEASSQLGIDGAIEIDTPEIDLGSSLVVLPSSVTNTEMSKNSCDTRKDKDSSSLVVNKQSGKTQSPDDLIVSGGSI